MSSNSSIIVRDQLSAILKEFHEANTRNFCHGGAIDLPLTSLHIDGVGDISIPIQASDLEKIKAKAAKAPFGRGQHTLQDLSVRDCWQIGATAISAPSGSSPSGGDFFGAVVPEFLSEAARGLGIDPQSFAIEAHLYKLLYYEEGGHFAKHRDSEKEAGMFATYLVEIPTVEGYEGGRLVINNQKKEMSFDWSKVDKEDDDGEVQTIEQPVNYDGSKTSKRRPFHHVMFYADCEHWLERVCRGSRVVLSFNVVWKNAAQAHASLPLMISTKNIVNMTRSLKGLDEFAVLWQEKLREEKRESKKKELEKMKMKKSSEPEAKRMKPNEEIDTNDNTRQKEGGNDDDANSTVSNMSNGIHSNWDLNNDNPKVPMVLIIPLEHYYSRANLSFAGLKGRDSDVANLLLGHPAFDVFVSSFTKYVEHGDEKYDSDDYDGSRWNDGSENEETDVKKKKSPQDRYEDYCLSYSIESYRDRNGRGFELCNSYYGGKSRPANIINNLSVVGQHATLKDYLESLQTYSEKEATTLGNEATKYEYWYHESVIVLCLKQHTMRVLFFGNKHQAFEFVKYHLDVYREYKSIAQEMPLPAMQSLHPALKQRLNSCGCDFMSAVLQNDVQTVHQIVQAQFDLAEQYVIDLLRCACHCKDTEHDYVLKSIGKFSGQIPLSALHLLITEYLEQFDWKGNREKRIRRFEFTYRPEEFIERLDSVEVGHLVKIFVLLIDKLGWGNAILQAFLHSDKFADFVKMKKFLVRLIPMIVHHEEAVVYLSSFLTNEEKEECKNPPPDTKDIESSSSDSD